MFRVGWGDCIAGCIDGIAGSTPSPLDGTVALQSEEGAAPPDDVWPSPMEDVLPGAARELTAGLTSWIPTARRR